MDLSNVMTTSKEKLLELTQLTELPKNARAASKNITAS